MACSVIEHIQNKKGDASTKTSNNSGLADSSFATLNNPYAQRYQQLDSTFKIHVKGGIPFDKDTTDDFLLFRPQYALSYNANLGIANWVSWELHSSWFGNSGRFNGNFLVDTGLPPSYFRANHHDYTNSGYDRGHLVRSHERTNNAENNRSTFYLSNCMPQHPDLNRGVWLSFEKHCESLCLDSGFVLRIISGGIQPCIDKLANNQLCIPAAFYKIVYIDRRTNDTNRFRVLSVIMPNEAGIRKADWRKYQRSISEIEALCGYAFPTP